MAYLLENGESVAGGLKRVMLEELESAATGLSGHDSGNRDEAVHEARKSIKKVRAILRLLGAARLNGNLRDIAHGLSALRDGVVCIETLEGLRKKYRQETRNKLRKVRAGLVERGNAAGEREIHAAAEALRRVSNRVERLRFPENAVNAAGFEATYRAGRKALSRARRHPDPETCHALRKRVKDHLYHVRLLANRWDEAMATHEKRLRSIETGLGEDHNLAVLRERVLAEPKLYGNSNDLALLLDLIGRYQKELRGDALGLAAKAYRRKRYGFVISETS